MSESISKCPMDGCPLKNPCVLVGMALVNVYYMYLAFYLNTTFLGGLFSMLFYICLLHVLGSMYGKMQKKEGESCPVPCLVDTTLTQEKYQESYEDLNLLLIWLRRILYCENVTETTVVNISPG